MFSASIRRGVAASAVRTQLGAARVGMRPLAAYSTSPIRMAEDVKPYEHNLTSMIEKRVDAAKEELVTLAETFMRYDGDRSGHLNREAIQAVLKDVELPFGDVEVDKLFSQLDENNDGAIQLNEWLDNLPVGTKLHILEKFSEEGAGSHRHIRMSLPSKSEIVYTYTDEAPMLATYSLLPMIKGFTAPCAVNVSLSDISVAARILANFPDYLDPSQRVADSLSDLGKLAKTPQANIIKLPNISASIPQLTGAIAELQAKGYNVPDYPMNPKTPEEEKVRARYAKVLGSAVNPVLREGNSDRRVAAPVKEYARQNPHRLKPWTSDSKTHVAHMTDGDFFGNEQAMVMPSAASVRIEHVDQSGVVNVLKEVTQLQKDELIDITHMDVQKLRAFFEQQINEAKEQDVLLSLHLKATMMKVSDPIMFGHAVTVYFKDVFDKHEALFAELGVNPNNGIADLYSKISTLPEAQQEEIKADIQACYAKRPALAMVDSDRGITNLHAPNDIIIDASVPPVIRDGGKMWGPDGELHDTKMVIPDRCYSTMYAEIVEDCKANGAFDVTKMGNVANVGLMAQKAEEYGSHDKTFEMKSAGMVRVVNNEDGAVLLETPVGSGDIFRMCQVKDTPIQDWVKLAVARARASGSAAVFWLDQNRPHDAKLIEKVNTYLGDHDTSGLELEILSPRDAMSYTLKRVRQGLDTISVTGNVLRDYLTDLFPILELGTSAKMLSIVPLLAGGGLFETGAGGSAPKHVQQLVKENHLRWDSLGEFLALAVSLEDLGSKTNNPQAKLVADALNSAVGGILTHKKSPSRKVNELDNRGSHYYLALYWAEALATQTQDQKLADKFASVAEQLRVNESKILDELNGVQGSAVDLGGYYFPDAAKAESVMRPSATLNAIIDGLGSLAK